MQRIVCLLLMGLFTIKVCMAQFSATGGANGNPYSYQPSISSGLDFVYVFDGMANAQLYFTAGSPSLWTWSRFEQNQSSAVPVSPADVQVSGNQTSLTNIQPGGYMIDSAGLKKHFVYVVEYKPLQVNGISYSPDCESCHTLSVSALTNEMSYYKISGIKEIIDRQFTLSWNTAVWNSTSKEYDTKSQTKTVESTPIWSVKAPLIKTRFTITCNDQIAKFFGSTLNDVSDEYAAVAVEANPEAVIQTRTALNEDGNEDPTLVYQSGSQPTGSAPVTIRFSSKSSEAVQYKEWFFYDHADGSGTYSGRYSEDEFEYKFQETGTFYVKLVVSNASLTCQDSSNYFIPKVLESFLDCPNFFTPRSSPGENDEFRVVYKSIVSFKGTILNRWGNVLFVWSDPAIGWNGTYRGKAVSPGVYFYVIEAKGSDGVVYKKKGDINLLE
ncbi:MAG: gliding motility-associated C-terminal domain-containing protein [Bacteroidales bacterium]|nr:gliding motility-associated C-terminal domain-containing protein [Bacteroidales bacterium]